MENKNITKINKLGKAVKILSRIAMVFAIIGSAFALIGGIITLCVDENAIRVEGTVDAKVYVSGIDIDLSPVLDNGGTIDFNDEIEIGRDTVMIEDYLEMNMSCEATDKNEVCIGLSSNLSDGLNIGKIKSEISIKAFSGCLLLAALAVGLGFATRLGKAIQLCETPFSEEIVKRMKRFGFSMIPFGVLGGVNGLLYLAIFVLVLILMIYIFSYGCALQTENDDTV